MIFLENVQGFVDSSVLATFKRILTRCGYKWRQYLLSPINTVGIPNNRQRFYMTIEHSSSICSNRWSVEDKERIYDYIPSFHEVKVRNISEFILKDMAAAIIKDLLVPEEVLRKLWSNRRLSIVGDFDMTSYCFTHSYGRMYDRSSGSMYIDNALGPLNVSEFALSRDDMTKYYGHLRRFHPQELLIMAGFPISFKWPDNLSLEKRWACIGNSINVTVVREVMRSMFEE